MGSLQGGKGSHRAAAAASTPEGIELGEGRLAVAVRTCHGRRRPADPAASLAPKRQDGDAGSRRGASALSGRSGSCCYGGGKRSR